MVIQVELFGIPRQRAGTPTVRLEFAGDRVALATVYAELARRFPAWAAACLDHGSLRPEYLVNIGGERFISDPGFPLQPGESLLLMSADAGG
jgi:molybdopterin converting factor small subunit